jgi:hypothetical protein
MSSTPPFFVTIVTDFPSATCWLSSPTAVGELITTEQAADRSAKAAHIGITTAAGEKP